MKLGRNPNRLETSDHTLASDIGRQVEPQASAVDTNPSLAALGLRALATMSTRIGKSLKRAAKSVGRTVVVAQKHSDHVVNTQAYLAQPRTRARMQQVAEMDRHAVLLGYLSSWVPTFLVALMIAAMIANDPVFVVAVLREALNVADSVPVTRVTEPSVLVSTAAGVAVTAILLLAAKVGAEALASLIFINPRKRLTDEHPELVRTAKAFVMPRRAVVAALAIAVLAFMMIRLHALASYRFGESQDAFAGFNTGGITLVSDHLVALIAWLPVMVLIFETIAAEPSLKHARKTHRWALIFRIRERISVRKEFRLLARWRKRLRRAKERVATLRDGMVWVGRAADAEFIEAAITTHAVGVTDESLEVGRTMTTGSTATNNARHVDEGVPFTYWAPTPPPMSNAVLLVLNSFEALQEAPGQPLLIDEWRRLRSDPIGYQPAARTDVGSGQEDVAIDAITQNGAAIQSDRIPTATIPLDTDGIPYNHQADQSLA
jgi:hypothetical protein